MGQENFPNDIWNQEMKLKDQFWKQRDLFEMAQESVESMDFSLFSSEEIGVDDMKVELNF